MPLGHLVRGAVHSQSLGGVGLIDMATVAKGADAVRARLDPLAGEGKAAAIADAIFDADLETLGRAALTHKVSCGASGLGLARAPPIRSRMSSPSRSGPCRLPRRQLLAGDAGADRGGGRPDAGAAP